MNILRKITFLFCLTAFASPAAAQNDVVSPAAAPSDVVSPAPAREPRDVSSEIIESIIEQISENSEREIDASELAEDLQWFSEHPINLNDARREDFEKLGFLSALQIENLMFYLYKNAPLASIYELQLVEGFNERTIRNLLSFVYVGEKAGTQQRKSLTFKELMKRGKNNIYIRSGGTFEEKAGYKNGKYLGEPFNLSARYLFSSSNKLWFGVVADKDEGEPFWTDKNKGFEFYSFHFQIKDLGRFKNIVAGDYRASFGLGLVISNDFLIGKSSYVLNVVPTASGLRRSSSLQEFNFLRGVGTTVNFGNFDITAFYSYRKLSATADGDSLSSFKQDGLFRTEADWAKRNNIGQQIIGGDVTYRHKYFRTGVTAVKTWFDTTVMPPPRVNNLYYFRGDQQFNIGWNYSFAVHRFRFAGETATDANWHFATLNTVTFNPVSNVGIAAVYRDYSPEYQAFYGNSFAEGSSVQNERGFYLGAEIQPIAKWKISAYADSYRFPWMRYTTYRPSDGYDILAQLDFATTSRLNMFARFRYEEQEKNFGTQSGDHSILVGNFIKSSLRYVLNYRHSSILQFRSTVEFNWVQRAVGGDSNGFTMFQDVSYAPAKLPLRFDLRLAVFDIPNWDNRVYTFERDVLWAFSVPAYYGVGSRMYLNLRYQPLKQLTLWFKIAQTIFSDRDVISSGNELINNNTKTDWRVMLNYKF